MTDAIDIAGAAVPRVSVIMPVFNAAAWLDESVGSVLGQVHADLELVCVDDASGDASVGLLEGMARRDGRLRILTSASNGGPSEARNRGIDAARGEYVCFVDADDSLPADALSRLLDACNSTGCDMALGALDWRRDAEQAPAPEGSGVVRVEDVGTSAFLQRVPGSHCCNLYQRQLLDRAEIRYAADLLLGEDQLFQAQALLAARRVAVLERVVYVYHHYRGQSLTRRLPSARLLCDDIEYQVRIARAFAAQGQPEPGWRLLEKWSWTIREHWLRMPGAMPVQEASKVFEAFRAMVGEFGVVPWVDSTPAAHRRLLEAVLSCHDEDALRLLAWPGMHAAGTPG